jgi:hypothetical protein
MGLLGGEVASRRFGKTAAERPHFKTVTVRERPLLTFDAPTWMAQSSRSHGTPHRHQGAGRRGCGTSAASRCMNSSGDITRCVVPSQCDRAAVGLGWLEPGIGR